MAQAQLDYSPMVAMLEQDVTADELAMELDEILFEFSYYSAIHNSGEQSIVIPPENCHNRIYRLRELRNVFAKMGKTGFSQVE